MIEFETDDAIASRLRKLAETLDAATRELIALARILDPPAAEGKS